MAAAARDYLAIPASEVAVERVFSTARDVLGIRRFPPIAEPVLASSICDADRRGIKVLINI
jgi:hypothetical protein